MKKFMGFGLKDNGYSFEWQNFVANNALKTNFSLIESFSGPGGMSLGLEWAGFNLLYAFDFDDKTVETHNYNLNNRCHKMDARMVKGPELLKELNLIKGELSLFSGGPPCQGFSKQRRNAHLGDNRNDLVLEYIRLVTELEPKFFLFENVAIFGQIRGRQYLDEMAERLKKYEFYPHFYNAADYGLPQTRERFIMVGKRRDIKAPFNIPKPTFSKWRTVKDAIYTLPSPPADYSEHPDYFNHQNAKVTGINVHRFSFVPQGGGWQDIPYELRLKCHQDANTKSGGWPDVYGRLAWDSQCPTITGGFDSFTRGRYGHPEENRPITPREAARIQGFPDYYRFIGNRGDIRSQIGNVVPPPLSEAIGLEILRCLFDEIGLLPERFKCYEEMPLFALA